MATTDPQTPGFILLLFRLLGGYNLSFTVLAIAITVTAFRRRERWAWRALLVENSLAFGAPMMYDQIVGSIGAFEDAQVSSASPPSTRPSHPPPRYFWLAVPPTVQPLEPVEIRVEPAAHGKARQGGIAEPFLARIVPQVEAMSIRRIRDDCEGPLGGQLRRGANMALTSAYERVSAVMVV